MTVLRFDGFVNVRDETVLIGGRDVIEEIEDVSWRMPYGNTRADGIVSVCLMDERFDGLLHATCGSEGYSEWTPGEAAVLIVGDHDVFDRLSDLEGQRVTLIVADEPANVLDEPEPEPKIQVHLLEIVARSGKQEPLNECINPEIILDLLSVLKLTESFVSGANNGPTLEQDYKALARALDRFDFSRP